ncbi:MAG: protein kinase [Myxococcaceae bacterium]|nr:protein kinase [Myxococcaceae bacterium]
MSIPFGKYQLLKKLAAGGMGQVFLARTGNANFEKMVVLKRILPHLVDDEEFFSMFMDEARIAARLNHPNIAQIFELGQERNTHFIVMEYVAGEDVRRVEKTARAAGKRIPVGLVLRIIADAAAGLDYAHKSRDSKGQPLNLVHRDISPQNILVGFDGGVKVIDFGVAKAAGRAQHTATGILKGKFPYMSPEQAEGEELDARSDIFSLGIVLWELLTDRRLFKGDSDIVSQKLVKQCQVPPPASLVSTIPRELDMVVLKALSKNPKDRFADAGALRLALEEFIQKKGLAASSAHLTRFMQDLYAERVAKEADPATLDELTLSQAADLSLLIPRDERIEAAHKGAQPSRVERGGGNLKYALGAIGLAAAGAIGWVLMNRPISTEPTPIDNRPLPAPVAKGTALDAAAAIEPAVPEVLAFKVNSEPAGATVEWNGKSLGVTPVDVSLEKTVLPAVLKISRESFEAQQITVTESIGPVVSLQLTKKKKGPGGPSIKKDR